MTSPHHLDDAPATQREEHMNQNCHVAHPEIVIQPRSWTPLCFFFLSFLPPDDAEVGWSGDVSSFFPGFQLKSE